MHAGLVKVEYSGFVHVNIVLGMLQDLVDRLPRATEAIPVGQEMETLQRELLENEVCEDYVQNNV